jgi:LysR family transcriptional regulator (chromosome initiation inhibitor)
MHRQFFGSMMKEIPAQLPIHYVPSTRTYADFIFSGLAYGLLPEQECRKRVDDNKLVSLFPQRPVFVDLYWHFWNLKSVLLDTFSSQLVTYAKELLHD